MQEDGTLSQRLIFRLERIAEETKRYLVVVCRTLRGRDICEMCDGTQGEPGNENVVDGKTVCDYCHAKLRPLPHG